MAWEVPRNRDITKFVLQRYKHDGNGFVSSGIQGRFQGSTGGGYGHGESRGTLEPDTFYKYVLTLIDDSDTTVIESSVTVRTRTVSGNASSTDATLIALTLSGIDFGVFDSTNTSYTATVANSVTQTTVTPTVNHSGASYQIKLNGVVDSDSVIPLGVGSNVISVEVTAEDGIVTKVYTVTVTRGGLPVTIEFSPASPVTQGEEVTVTMSFADLTLDDSSNLVFRADVLDASGADADVCEGNGMGVNQKMQVVDENPEVRTVTVSADCKPGSYTVKVDLTSAKNVKLASASAHLSIVAPTPEELERRLRIRYDTNNNDVIDRDEVLAAVRDYFNGAITADEILVVVGLYFAG